MKLLYISHLPLDRIIGGGISREFNLLLQAAKRHEVTAIIPCAPQRETALQSTLSAHAVRVVSVPLIPPLRAFAGLHTFVRLLQRRSVGWDLIQPSLQLAIDTTLANCTFEIIHLSTPFLRRLRLPSYCSIVSNTHNVEWEIFHRGLHESRSLRKRIHFALMGTFVRRDEVACCRLCDVVMAVSERDRQLFRKDLPNLHAVVVPNGVDTSFFAPPETPLPGEDGLLLFTGSMDYYPNEQAAKILINEILPLVQRQIHNARVAIVGANPTDSLRQLASEKVIITGMVDDIRPWFARAQVVVVPLRIGGGTRLKILEAMAMSAPVVTTSLGCEGLNVEHGRNIFIKDDNESFVEAVVYLLKNPQQRKTIARAARALVIEQYAWSAIGQSLQAAYQVATSKSRHAAQKNGSSPSPIDKGACAMPEGT
jgi:glycosyltransferase involved in cell wall biosynthesis